jgi:hypothetical protein
LRVVNRSDEEGWVPVYREENDAAVDSGIHGGKSGFYNQRNLP